MTILMVPAATWMKGNGERTMHARPTRHDSIGSTRTPSSTCGNSAFQPQLSSDPDCYPQFILQDAEDGTRWLVACTILSQPAEIRLITDDGVAVVPWPSSVIRNTVEMVAQDPTTMDVYFADSVSLWRTRFRSTASEMEIVTLTTGFAAASMFAVNQSMVTCDLEHGGVLLWNLTSLSFITVHQPTVGSTQTTLPTSHSRTL